MSSEGVEGDVDLLLGAKGVRCDILALDVNWGEII